MENEVTSGENRLMIICVFSDVHGNYLALEQMILNEMQTVDCFFFLGDIFGYFYQQKKIIDRLMKMDNLFFLKGNHDQYYLQCQNDERYRERLIQKYGQSYKLELETQEIAFLNSAPDYMEVNLGGRLIGAYHGGPYDPLEQRIYPDTEVMFKTEIKEYDCLLIGHTHYRLLKKAGNTIILNPGSLGQPRDENGFSYCVLDTETMCCEFKNVFPDIAQLLCETKINDYGNKNWQYLREKYEG